jgi:hypothetical protein
LGQIQTVPITPPAIQFFSGPNLTTLNGATKLHTTKYSKRQLKLHRNTTKRQPKWRSTGWFLRVPFLLLEWKVLKRWKKI